MVMSPLCIVGGKYMQAEQLGGFRRQGRVLLKKVLFLYFFLSQWVMGTREEFSQVLNLYPYICTYIASKYVTPTKVFQENSQQQQSMQVIIILTYHTAIYDIGQACIPITSPTQPQQHFSIHTMLIQACIQITSPTQPQQHFSIHSMLIQVAIENRCIY